MVSERAFFGVISPAPDLAAIPETIWEEARLREALIRPLAEPSVSPKEQVLRPIA